MKKTTTVGAGVVILLIGFVIFIQSLEFDYKSDLGPGPGFFPIWLSGILIVLSFFYIIESIKGKNPSSESWPSGHALKQILFVLAALIIFVVLLSWFGFIFAGIAFLFLLFNKNYRWFTSLAISVGVTFFTFWLFNNVLGVALPR